MNALQIEKFIATSFPEDKTTHKHNLTDEKVKTAVESLKKEIATLPPAKSSEEVQKLKQLKTTIRKLEVEYDAQNQPTALGNAGAWFASWVTPAYTNAKSTQTANSQGLRDIEANLQNTITQSESEIRKTLEEKQKQLDEIRRDIKTNSNKQISFDTLPGEMKKEAAAELLKKSQIISLYPKGEQALEVQRLVSAIRELPEGFEKKWNISIGGINFLFQGELLATLKELVEQNDKLNFINGIVLPREYLGEFSDRSSNDDEKILERRVLDKLMEFNALGDACYIDLMDLKCDTFEKAVLGFDKVLVSNPDMNDMGNYPNSLLDVFFNKLSTSNQAGEWPVKFKLGADTTSEDLAKWSTGLRMAEVVDLSACSKLTKNDIDQLTKGTKLQVIPPTK